MNNWHWHNEILTCELLAQWQHGFFTRSHSPQLPQDLHSSFYADAPDGRAYRVTQVHGDRIIEVNEVIELEASPERPKADGIWLSGKVAKSSAWVCSADCVPVLIGDRFTGAIAAVHAGWRGTAAGIVLKAIALFCDRGSNLSDLGIALGPAISGESYQVSQLVADQLMATLKSPKGIFPDPKPEHCRLDIRQVQQQQLIELGINPDQIAIAPFCTLLARDQFFSYRRNVIENPINIGKSPQVQWSGIAVN